MNMQVNIIFPLEKRKRKINKFVEHTRKRVLFSVRIIVHHIGDNSFIRRTEEKQMKGYVVESGYMGYVDGQYVLFADESDYAEMYEEIEG